MKNSGTTTDGLKHDPLPLESISSQDIDTATDGLEHDPWSLESISSQDIDTDLKVREFDVEVRKFDVEVIQFEIPKEDFGELFDSSNIDKAEDWNKFIKSYEVFSFFARKYLVYHSDKGLLLKKKEIIQQELNKLKIQPCEETDEETDEETRPQPRKIRCKEKLEYFLRNIDKDEILKGLRNARDHYIPANTTKPLDAQALQEEATLSPQP